VIVTDVSPLAGPEFGNTEVMAGGVAEVAPVANRMDPVTSPAAQNVVTGQDTSQITLLPLTSVVVQVGLATAGSEVVRTLPALSVATQNEPLVPVVQSRPAIQ
jgi:hypothetical protein